MSEWEEHERRVSEHSAYYKGRPITYRSMVEASADGVELARLRAEGKEPLPEVDAE